jgi:quercetin dioxygenase-like cupin family protein
MTVDPTRQRKASLSTEEKRDYEGLFARWADFYERTHHAPTLIRGSDVPYIVSRMGASNFYLIPHMEDTPLMQWVVFVRYMKDHPNGRHRHQGGIALFGIDGRGYSIVNGRRYDWGRGDVVFLPLVPGGLDHQHFPAVPGEAATFMGIIYEPLIVAVGAEMTQLEPQDLPEGELDPDATAAGNTSGSIEIEPTLDGLIQLRRHESEELNLPIIIRGDELDVDHSGFGDLRWYLHPGRPGFAGTSPSLVFTLALKQGESTQELFSPGNGFMYVLDGTPKIGIDDEIHATVPGDMVCLPARRNGVRSWIESPKGDVNVLVAMANLAGLGGVALGAGFALNPRDGTTK